MKYCQQLLFIPPKFSFVTILLISFQFQMASNPGSNLKQNSQGKKNEDLMENSCYQIQSI